MHLLKQVTIKDRFNFTIFLSFSLHAVLLIGLGFDFFQKRQSEPIQVTLVQKKINRPSYAPKDVIIPADTKLESQPESLLTKSSESLDLEEIIEDLQAKLTR